MLFAGIDMGSHSAKLVVLREKKVVFVSELAIAEDSAVVSKQLLAAALEELDWSSKDLHVISTGTGWSRVPFANDHRSQQLCHSKGASWPIPSARTVLDVGADGCRAMSLNAKGKVVDFASTSKCAAGTGTFLEAMAKIMELSIAEMSEVAFKRKDKAKVSSFCAVFAESEVISNIHKGISKERIIAGIHESVVDRLMEILKKVGVKGDVVVTGGVARNIDIIYRLGLRVGLELKVPERPERMGALGAALIASEVA